MLYIKNGYCIDPRSGQEGYWDLLIDQGRIEKMVRPEENLQQPILTKSVNEDASEAQDIPGQPNESMPKLHVIDASGCIIGPGLVDVHVHFRDPGQTEKEDISTGAAAAAAGGYTSLVMMANTRPPVDNAETLSYVLEKGKSTGLHVYASAALTESMKGQNLTDMETLYHAGAAGFTDDGLPVLDEELLRQALKRAGALGCPISLHEEDPAYIVQSGVNAGFVAEKLGLTGASREAEISLIKRDIEIARTAGGTLNIQHVSTKEGVALLREAKAAGIDVHGEATPHHFTLTEEAVLEKGTLAKMNPPLRTEADRQAILEGIADGTLDLIATDHAPHTQAEKERPFTEAPSGIIGLETALSLGLRELVEPKILTLSTLFKRMSLAPAALYGMDAGYLAEGGPADLVIFDPKASRTVGAFRSKASNSPFTGEQMPGKVRYTICGGEVVFGDGDH